MHTLVWRVQCSYMEHYKVKQIYTLVCQYHQNVQSQEGKGALVDEQFVGHEHSLIASHTYTVESPCFL